MRTQILTEMAGLFPDEVMNIGCDETGSKAPCTTNNTKSFEVKMIQHLLKIGKQPMGWEEVGRPLLKIQSRSPIRPLLVTI